MMFQDFVNLFDCMALVGDSVALILLLSYRLVVGQFPDFGEESPLFSMKGHKMIMRLRTVIPKYILQHYYTPFINLILIITQKITIMASKKQLRQIYAQIKAYSLIKLSNNYHTNLKIHLQHIVQQRVNLKAYSQEKSELTICSYIPKINQEIIPPFLQSYDYFKNSQHLILRYGYPYFSRLSLEMQFKLFESDKKETWKAKLFGVKIPLQSAQSVTPDLLLVPLICFDRNLNRIGYGGGYYDNYIRSTREKCNGHLLCVGVGLSCLKIQHSRIPTQAHDQPLDCIITETQILYKANHRLFENSSKN